MKINRTVIVISVVIAIGLTSYLCLPNLPNYFFAAVTSITFYGRVVDELGIPIKDASVHIFVADKFFKPGSTYDETSDGSGRFSITGVHGLGVGVNVFKDGYYRTDRSSAQCHYGIHDGSGIPIPTPLKPAIFVLSKRRKAAFLIARDVKMTFAANHQPYEINLSTGKVVDTGQGDITVQYWANDQNSNYLRYQPYDWHFEISVPGGGLLHRAHGQDFTAPEAGYQVVDEVDMPRNTTPRWADQASREYFVKLRNNSYARLSISVRTGQANGVTIKSYLNSNTGDRNLESNEQQFDGNP